MESGLKVHSGTWKYTLFVIVYYTSEMCTAFRVLNKDNIYIDMQAGRNLLPNLLVADN